MIMGNYTFEEIKKNILNWIQSEKIRDILQCSELEITKNNENILLLDLTFNHCLAQLTVSNPFFAPYQFVSFEAMTLDSEKAQETGKPELVYFFYDSSEMTEQIVTNELEIGIEYCSYYIPNHIRKKFLDKRGILVIDYENLYHIVHPDDIKKINGESVKGEFICKDVEAQYLVVKNDMLALRILSQNFVVTVCG